MNAINLQPSVNNLPLMDRLQQDVHRTPVVNQQQNAQITREEAQRRMAMPVQPDGVESKTIDPKAQRREDERRRKQKRRDTTGGKKAPSATSGHIVDFSA